MAWMPRDQFVFVEGLGHGVVCAHAERANLVLDPGKTGEDEDGRLYQLEGSATHRSREVQVQKDDVVVVDLRELDGLMAKVRNVRIEALRFQHELEALRDGA